MPKPLIAAVGLCCMLSAALAGRTEEIVPTKVTADKHNRLLMNGIPWFPICLSAGPPPIGTLAPDGRDGLAVLGEGGVDSFRVTVRDPEELIPGLRRQLDWAAAHGMYCFPNLGDLTVFDDKHPERPDQLRAVVEEFRGHPALAVWKCKDEPAWGEAPIESLKQACDFIKKADPDHPIWMTHAPRNTLELLREYSVACDIAALDIYPISVPPGKHSHLPNKEISVVGDYTQWIRKAVYDRKPVWMVLQIGWSGATPPKNVRIFPTLHQERFMVYQAIINGARGLLFFGGRVALEGRDKELGFNWTFWEEVLEPILGEIGKGSELHEALLAPDSKARLKASGACDIEFLAREAGGHLYLMACKREGPKADITFSAKALDGEIEVMFESRAVRAGNGSFTDSFGPNDVHIYKVRMKHGHGNGT